MIDAYKTPTLRSLGRTGPYFHTGTAEEVREVVAHHATGNTYLDPKMRRTDGSVRGDDLTTEEVDALVLFLRALNGRPVDPVLQKSP